MSDPIKDAQVNAEIDNGTSLKLEFDKTVQETAEVLHSRLNIRRFRGLEVGLSDPLPSPGVNPISARVTFTSFLPLGDKSEAVGGIIRSHGKAWGIVSTDPKRTEDVLGAISQIEIPEFIEQVKIFSEKGGKFANINAALIAGITQRKVVSLREKGWVNIIIEQRTLNGERVVEDPLGQFIAEIYKIENSENFRINSERFRDKIVLQFKEEEYDQSDLFKAKGIEKPELVGILPYPEFGNTMVEVGIEVKGVLSDDKIDRLFDMLTISYFELKSDIKDFTENRVRLVSKEIWNFGTDLAKMLMHLFGNYLTKVTGFNQLFLQADTFERFQQLLPLIGIQARKSRELEVLYEEVRSQILKYSFGGIAVGKLSASQELINPLKAMAAEKPDQVQVEIAEEVLNGKKMWSVPNIVHAFLENIISNALDIARQRSLKGNVKIVVTTETIKDHEYVKIFYQDESGGMETEQIRSILVDEAEIVESEHEGTGTGLTTMRRILNHFTPHLYADDDAPDPMDFWNRKDGIKGLEGVFYLEIA